MNKSYSCLPHVPLFLSHLVAEFWSRVYRVLRPSPGVVHYVLTHFQWLWNIINRTVLRDWLMHKVLTGKFWYKHKMFSQIITVCVWMLGLLFSVPHMLHVLFTVVWIVDFCVDMESCDLFMESWLIQGLYSSLANEFWSCAKCTVNE